MNGLASEPIPNSQAVLIGIDPDSNKSGVALYRKSDKSYKLSNLTFFELFDYLEERKHLIHLVVIEAGWLNKGTWHGVGRKGAYVAARIGKNVGTNHETAKKIEEMCIYLDLPYELVRPRMGKLKAKEFERVTGIKERTNPEKRDAFMLVFGR